MAIMMDKFLSCSVEPLMLITLQLGALVPVGAVPQGERRMAKVAGGSFTGVDVSGAQFAGNVEAGCVDWQLLRHDGVLEMDAQYVLHESGGAIIRVLNQAMRHGPADVLAALARGEAVDPAQYYYRALLRFETSSAGFSWLNRTLAVASAARRGGTVEISVAALR